MLAKTYTDPIYKHQVWIYTKATNKTFKLAAKEIHPEIETPRSNTWQARTLFKPGFGAIIFFKDQAPPPWIVAHEALHIVHGVMELVGVKLTLESDEAFAYYLEYHVREITKLLS